MLVSNYFQYHKQRVRSVGTQKHWLNITKGAPQGSMFGPFAYNIYSNDLLYLMSEICDKYNYADDNTLGCGGNIIYVTNKMEHATDIMLNWFNSNLMQANPKQMSLNYI